MLAFYMHLGPFSRYVMGRLDEMIAEAEARIVPQVVEQRAMVG